MASGPELVPLPDIESGPSAKANANGEVSSSRSHRGARFVVLAAAVLGSMGMAASYQSSPPSSSMLSSSATRRQLSSHWNKEYSREPLIEKASKQAEVINKEVQAKIRISFDEFPTDEQQEALKQALVKEMEVNEEDVTEFSVTLHQSGAYNKVVPSKKEDEAAAAAVSSGSPLAAQRMLPISAEARAKAAKLRAERAKAAAENAERTKVACDIVITVKQDSPEAAELLKQHTDSKFIDAEHECAYLASHTGMPSYSCRWTVQRINDDDWDDDWLSRLQKDGHDVVKLHDDGA